MSRIGPTRGRSISPARIVLRRLGLGAVEQVLVLVRRDLAALEAEPSAQHDVHRLGPGRAVERGRHVGPPVDDHRVAGVVVHVPASDVEALSSPAAQVEPAEEQRGLGVVRQRQHPLVQGGREVRLGDARRRRGRPGRGWPRASPAGRRARRRGRRARRPGWGRSRPPQVSQRRRYPARHPPGPDAAGPAGRAAGSARSAAVANTSRATSTCAAAARSCGVVAVHRHVADRRPGREAVDRVERARRPPRPPPGSGVGGRGQHGRPQRVGDPPPHRERHRVGHALAHQGVGDQVLGEPTGELVVVHRGWSAGTASSSSLLVLGDLAGGGTTVASEPVNQV